MNDLVVIALVGAGGALIGSIITSLMAPWVKFAIQKRMRELEEAREQTQRCRELITTWRAMVNEIARQAQPSESSGSIKHSIQLHVDYLSLEPHLSKEGRRWAYAPVRLITIGVEIPEPLYHLQQEIARIEREWGLA